MINHVAALPWRTFLQRECSLRFLRSIGLLTILVLSVLGTSWADEIAGTVV
jgi:hypothetical protein